MCTAAWSKQKPHILAQTQTSGSLWFTERKDMQLLGSPWELECIQSASTAGMALGSNGGACTPVCSQHLSVLGMMGCQGASTTMPLHIPSGAAAQLPQQEDFFFVSSPSPVFATSILVPDDTVVALSSAGVTADS